MKRQHKIIVVLDGGLIQEIANIPRGVIVEVRDFDIEGADDDELSGTPNGEKAIVSTWTWEGGGE